MSPPQTAEPADYLALRMAPPQKYHRANHEGPFDGCWRCDRARATCRSKIAFESLEEADEWVRELNETEGYERAVVRYRCRECLRWHMKTAKDKHEKRRAERARRKWLIGTPRPERVQGQTAAGGATPQ